MMRRGSLIMLVMLGTVMAILMVLLIANQGDLTALTQYVDSTASGQQIAALKLDNSALKAELEAARMIARGSAQQQAAQQLTDLRKENSILKDSLTKCQSAQQTVDLQKEVSMLKDALLKYQSTRRSDLQQPPSPAQKTADDVKVIKIDLAEYLGASSYLEGISWDVNHCIPPIRTVWPNIDNATFNMLHGKVVKELRQSLADIVGIDEASVDNEKWFHEYLGATRFEQIVSDPRFLQWRERIAVVLSKYLIHASETMQVVCDGVNKEIRLAPADLGGPKSDCTKKLSAKQVVEQLGNIPFPFDGIRHIAAQYANIGVCTKPARPYSSYGEWLVKDRMFNPAWRTYEVDNLEQDAVVFLFDILYEKKAVFKQQYWMGVINMQNPFDMYSIQDIIFNTRPDVLIETGTANGGSALVWSSVMELAEMDNSVIVTMDINSPKWEPSTTWGGDAKQDPTKHKLWSKRVRFLQGDATEPVISHQVKEIAMNKKVMVLLDSSHRQEHVTKEMDIYCPMVSVGCYCIVEDTKMSRWASNGPLEAVKKFLAEHPEFEMDRSRELLYSQHAMGYLKRIR